MAKDPVLVVLQLSGGNDYINTVIPYANSLYWDNRPVVHIPEDKIDRKSTRLNSSHIQKSRMPSSA